MNTLPPELHSLIFEFACTDDGYTARSLSLVSHYTRDASKAFLYQCLSVAGLDQLLTITEKLEEAPHRLRRVRHLFLSDWTVSQTKMRLVPVNNEDMDRYEAEKSAIIHLLNLSASTLESLTIIISCPYNGAQIIGHLFSLSFPRLTDLSIHGFYPFPHSPNSFPRLERLHLSGNRNPHGLLQTGGLASSCPSLTQLKISGIVSASTFAEELDRTITSIRTFIRKTLPLGSSFP
ncbi:hypothetical protein C8Q75DRAFT_791081 [Abortiporus biennis]|nr:hypothetical protein C8Q75DRAFT_791081 [Abortiporus biennis]